MKKLKFLPTVLMLVLCVGVLAIGIYAITPSKNTIDGTITIGASPAEVRIDCYVGDSTGTPTTYESVRSGMTWTPVFEMGTGDANTQAEIPEYVLTIKVTNKSDKELGVYFLEGTLPTDGYATGENIRTTGVLKKSDRVDESGNAIALGAGETDDTLVNVNFDVYKYLAPKDDATGNVVEMKIYFKCADFMDACKLAFNYKLNIEEYKPNVALEADASKGIVALSASRWTSVDVTYEGEPYGSVMTHDFIECGTPNAPKFIKLSKEIVSIGGSHYTWLGDPFTSDNGDIEHIVEPAKDFYKNENIEYVVATNKLTSLGYYGGAYEETDVTEYDHWVGGEIEYNFGAFEKCTNLKWVSVPSANTAANTFRDCASLSLCNIKTTSVDQFAFANCTNLALELCISGNMTIGSYAFKGCSVSIILDDPNFENISRLAFSDVNTIKTNGTIDISDGKLILTDGALSTTVTGTVYPAIPHYIRQFITSVVIPEGFTSLADLGFVSCCNLVSVKLPSTFTTLKITYYDGDDYSSELYFVYNYYSGDFADCPSLTTINIPKSIQSIPAGVFDMDYPDTSALSTSGVTFETQEGKYWYYNDFTGDYDEGYTDDYKQITSVEDFIDAMHMDSWYAIEYWAPYLFEQLTPEEFEEMMAELEEE